jgi:hypothetical protein
MIRITVIGIIPDCLGKLFDGRIVVFIFILFKTFIIMGMIFS